MLHQIQRVPVAALLPDRESGVSESFEVTCPYCGEDLEIYLERDVRGELVQDCEVCCNPWLIRVEFDEDGRRIQVSRADGSE